MMMLQKRETADLEVLQNNYLSRREKACYYSMLFCIVLDEIVHDKQHISDMICKMRCWRHVHGKESKQIDRRE